VPLGLQLYMLGANRRAALLVGLRPRWLLATSFVISGVLAGWQAFSRLPGPVGQIRMLALP
jgi:ribose/xylose/arabinose/galactoside ABC-type transport system permease subunit